MSKKESNDYQLENIPCPVCGKSKNVPFLEGVKELYNNLDDQFNIVKCSNCRFCYTNPRPTADTMSYFYPDDAGYFIPTSDPVRPYFEHQNPLIKKLRIRTLNKYFNYNISVTSNVVIELLLPLYFLLTKKRVLLNHIPHFKPGGRLLDVGCSWGRYLRQMQQLGWGVYGLEYNPSATNKARSLLNVEEDQIQNNVIEEAEFPDSYFDVIQLSMVLEHLHHPMKALKKIHKMLKPGGQLIISVPNINGIEVKLYKKYSYTLHVPAHLNHFSPGSLARALGDNEFKIDKFIFHHFERDLLAPLEYKKSRFYNLFHNKYVRKLFIKPLVRILSTLKLTSRMTVYCTLR